MKNSCMWIFKGDQQWNLSSNIIKCTWTNVARKLQKHPHTLKDAACKWSETNTTEQDTSRQNDTKETYHWIWVFKHLRSKNAECRNSGEKKDGKSLQNQTCDNVQVA